MLSQPTDPQGFGCRVQGILVEAILFAQGGEGVHIKVISELLGHSDIVITLRTYGYLLPSMQSDAVVAWEEDFRKPGIGDLLIPPQVVLPRLSEFVKRSLYGRGRFHLLRQRIEKAS